MFHTYAGGNDGGWANAGIPFSPNEDPQMVDAYALAARFDYAVAANLNIWGAYMWATGWKRMAFWPVRIHLTAAAGNVLLRLMPPSNGKRWLCRE